ncbi:hypothetical protein [Erwinia pyrifoliae]|uniref:hypothetical protein n=1 Tax=Erwinia pyrifoliae TaxID=79967 RepID=UPI00223C07EC|nr:hypothetical protein [Erwinia pyrifoliae]MCT2385536.1 hypothetical protein [Erwinia pyrifoliae]MCU8588891.1 hypothetical protein [Erwinia pyrifoliae]
MVQIVNYLRAKMLHSSKAAFSLAIKNNTYLSFAEKIISAKNERTHCDLIKTHSDLTKEILTNNKTLKYESFLENLSEIKSQHHKKHELELEHKLLDYSKLLPRLNVIKTKGNKHEYVLPYNNQQKGIIITAVKESLI